jgi:hypothetical protein
MSILSEPCKYANLSYFPLIMGRVPKSHSIHVQNPTKSTFSNKDLVWTSGIRHGEQNKVNIQFAYVPYAHILEFLEGEQGDTNNPVEWNVYKNFISQTNVKQPIIKIHLGHVVNIYGINLFNFFNSYIKDVIIYVLSVFLFKYQCRYGLEDYWKDSTHTQSIK